MLDALTEKECGVILENLYWH